MLMFDRHVARCALNVLLAGILVVLPAVSAHADSSPRPVGSGVQMVPFGPGEESRFAIKFGFVRAGSASLSVEGPEMFAGRPAVRLISRARSSSFFSRIFRVEDHVESWWSVDDNLTLRFERHIREGDYRRDEVVVYDHHSGEAVYPDGSRVGFAPGSLDILAAFYWVRTRSLEPGLDLRVPSHNDKQNHDLRIRVLRREIVKVPAGEFPCVVVEPLLESAGLFRQEGRLTVWLTDDARRMPVKMKSKVKVGSITAELESYRPGAPIDGALPGREGN